TLSPCGAAHQMNQNLTQLNQPLLHQLAEWNKVIRGILPEAIPLGVADILRWNGVIQIATTDEDILQAAAMQALQQALADFSASRAREGEKLALFLEQRIKQILSLCAQVAPRIPAAIAVYEERLTARLRAALNNSDDERILQEITLFAGKIDVNEELSRLQTHLNEVRRVLAQGGTVGKRLDFLMQELHREANTLGAKSVEAEVSYAAMEMKLLIEQMREQIQNIE
ncbi:MAG: YicC/YloC family endoribonuclease, partial [Candidatus Nitrotoga sp.]